MRRISVSCAKKKRRKIKYIRVISDEPACTNHEKYANDPKECVYAEVHANP